MLPGPVARLGIAGRALQRLALGSYVSPFSKAAVERLRPPMTTNLVPLQSTAAADRGSIGGVARRSQHHVPGSNPRSMLRVACLAVAGTNPHTRTWRPVQIVDSTVKSAGAGGIDCQTPLLRVERRSVFRASPCRLAGKCRATRAGTPPSNDILAGPCRQVPRLSDARVRRQKRPPASSKLGSGPW